MATFANQTKHSSSYSNSTKDSSSWTMPRLPGSSWTYNEPLFAYNSAVVDSNIIYYNGAGTAVAWVNQTEH